MSNNSPTQYFEPFCKWRREEKQDVVEVHLQGFKREQLKATINKLGVLKITGERRDKDSTSFRKEIVVSKDCIRDEIRAKFSAGIIYITMPKRTPADTKQTRPAEADQGIPNNEDKQSELLPAAATLSTMNNIEPTKCMSGAFPMDRITALKLEALAAGVAVGAYVALSTILIYILRSNS